MTQSPVIFQGTNVCERRVLTYWTMCPRCAKLKACVKRRAPVEECKMPGYIRFCFDDNTGAVTWSGVIRLKDIEARTAEYLEVDEEDLPDDVAIPPRQMAFEELT